MCVQFSCRRQKLIGIGKWTKTMPKRARDLQLWLLSLVVRRWSSSASFCYLQAFALKYAMVSFATWRLALERVLLLLLVGTIYVSHFFFVFRSFLFEAFISHMSLPDSSDCVMHFRLSIWPNAMSSISISASYLFFNFSVVVCMPKKTDNRLEKEKRKIAWLMHTCQKGIFPTRLLLRKIRKSFVPLLLAGWLAAVMSCLCFDFGFLRPLCYHQPSLSTSQPDISADGKKMERYE